MTRRPAAARELAPILADGERGGSIFIKDEETCIRCGLCARRCPVGTITMQSFHTPEERPCLTIRTERELRAGRERAGATS